MAQWFLGNTIFNFHMLMTLSQVQEMTLTLNTKCSCLHLPTFRSHVAMVSKKSSVLTFSYREALGQGQPRVII